MLAYGAAKAAVLHIAKSVELAGDVIALMPVTLDTPANRAAMPKADKSAWTLCCTVSEYFRISWC